MALAYGSSATCLCRSCIRALIGPAIKLGQLGPTIKMPTIGVAAAALVGFAASHGLLCVNIAKRTILKLAGLPSPLYQTDQKESRWGVVRGEGLVVAVVDLRRDTIQ